MEEGAKIHVGLHADLIDRDYVWRWEARRSETAGQAAFNFAQSTFQGAALSLQNLRRKELHHMPTLSETGRAELWILERMNGDVSLQTIAQGALEQFPRLFTSWQAAVVAELSERLSR